VGSGYDAAAEEAALAAVVAHGLFSPLAVLTGAAFAVRRFGGSLTSEEYEDLTTAVVAQSEVLTEGLDSILRHRGAGSDELADLLDQLDVATDVLRHGLQALVRGLSPEAIELLDALRARR
jgi:K+-sensing histidine kinase KdpD